MGGVVAISPALRIKSLRFLCGFLFSPAGLLIWESVLRVKLAKTAGFCWGVERALDIVLDTANKTDGPVYTHGPLIHNPQTVDLLKEKQVHPLDPDETVQGNSLLVIRAHGISPIVRERLRNSGANIRDATCPLVAKVHGVIRKHSRMGAATIIIGEEGHPEVAGHMGYAEAGKHLITCVEDVENLPAIDGEVIVVAQTTINMDEFTHVVEAIQAKFPQVQMFNTICDATEERQREVKKLAPGVDLMIVVGGRNSGNSNRLVEVAREEGAEAILVETEEEIDPDFLRKFKEIAVTAGASTPDWMIRRVVNRIESIPVAEKGVRDRFMETLKWLSRANVFLFFVAAMASVMAHAVAGIPLEGEMVLVAAAYLFSLHTLNRCASFEADRFNEPNRAFFFEQNQKTLITAGVLAGLVSFAVAASISVLVFLILVTGMILNMFYSVWVEPRGLQKKRMLDFPASKTCVTTIGWTTATALLPAVAAPENIGLPWGISVLVVFCLSLFRTGIMELRDMQGDRIVGKRTLAITLGKEKTLILLAAVMAGMGALLLAGVVSGVLPLRYGLAMLLPAAYGGGCLYLYLKKIIGHSGLTEVVLDFQFIQAGLLALLLV